MPIKRNPISLRELPSYIERQMLPTNHVAAISPEKVVREARKLKKDQSVRTDYFNNMEKCGGHK